MQQVNMIVKKTVNIQRLPDNKLYALHISERKSKNWLPLHIHIHLPGSECLYTHNYIQHLNFEKCLFFVVTFILLCFGKLSRCRKKKQEQNKTCHAFLVGDNQPIRVSFWVRLQIFITHFIGFVSFFLLQRDSRSLLVIIAVVVVAFGSNEHHAAFCWLKKAQLVNLSAQHLK